MATTLADAATYATKLPKREHDAPEWRAARAAGRSSGFKIKNRKHPAMERVMETFG